MKSITRIFLTALLCVCSAALYAEDSLAPAPSLSVIDGESSHLAVLIGQELARVNPQKATLRVYVGSFVLSGRSVSLGSLWTRNLLTSLSGVSGRDFVIIMDTSAVDYVLSGEIISAGGTVRIFTHLVKQDGQSLAASWTSDIPAASIPGELFGTTSPGRGFAAGAEGSASENAVHYTWDMGWVSRSLRRDAEDWFLVTADKDGTLILETSGSSDTLLFLYDADSQDLLEEDDDSGNGLNARIEYVGVRIGERYLVRVTIYNDRAGDYRFRATMQQDHNAL